MPRAEQVFAGVVWCYRVSSGSRNTQQNLPCSWAAAAPFPDLAEIIPNLAAWQSLRGAPCDSREQAVWTALQSIVGTDLPYTA